MWYRIEQHKSGMTYPHPCSTVFRRKFQEFFIQFTTSIKFSQLDLQFNVTAEKLIFRTHTQSGTLQKIRRENFHLNVFIFMLQLSIEKNLDDIYLCTVLCESTTVLQNHI